MAKPWLVLALAFTGCTARTVDLDGANPSPNPYAYIPNQNSAYEVVVDDRRVYWTTAQHFEGPPRSLRSCLKSNCAGTIETFIEFPRVPNQQAAVLSSLTLDSTGVYWRGGDYQGLRTIEKCGHDGCPSGPVTVVTAPADSLVADGQEFYFSSSRDAAIYACSAEGCSVARREVVLHQTFTSTLIVHDAYLYWQAESVIWRHRKDGTGESEALVNVSNVAAMAVSDDYLYWTTYNAPESASVLRCPVAGCAGTPEVVASTQSSPYRLAADSRGVYWLSWDTPVKPGEVRGCPAEGCGDVPATFASSQTFNNLSMALDVDHIYWVTDGGSGGLGPFPFAAIGRAAR